ncbi:MAG: glycosyltransferase family 2 protein [Lachnospiraceae bacterium]|nr:glycosyltransferase family 2 protein [Lachnospiraceae bacterium]
MNKVAAVVVTYNRKELLKECIEALKASTCSVNIIIVDNNSTDGTKEYIADLIGKDVIYKRLKKNLGGAGGFSAGMKYAVKKGYEYVWIMDDDTIVKKDTLEVLLKAKDEISDDFGFISSSVKWIDGSDCKMNRQTYKEQISDYEKSYVMKGIYPVKAATFVSLLFSSDAIKQIGLPLKEYFIWGDDKEYTLRMSNEFACYNVVDSQVVHKMNNNEGSNITKDDIGRIDRYYYAYRNDFATARSQGIKDLLIYMAGFMLNAVRIILFAPSNKSKRLGIMLKGLKDGIAFRPRVRYVK